MLAVFSATLTRTAPAAARIWGAASAGLPQSLSAFRITAPPSPSSSSSSSPFLASQSRGSKHPSYNGKKLPGYLLPHQSEKTSHLKQMLKMKWHRLKAGKAGQRPKSPRYGRDDFVLSKMNM
ncbi:hypothetical protein HDU87_007012 [Geranomyces variabilis]|uniref:Uncharacterized protein n=1 Tax=Geranomyces variabilis TaxID=109894 RepID=A0AAD5TGY5_9FUNG|nr:hypothetical protein HDU87_007012 [Geranomyces variabilis]